jgi:kinetochore protein Spc24, fungi type
MSRSATAFTQWDFNYISIIRMNALESLATPVQDTLSILEIHNDIALVDAVNNKIHQLDTFTEENISSFQLRIDELHRQLDNILSSIKSLKSSTQSKSTKLELKKLENEMFNSARNLTSLNMEINSLKLSYNDNLKKLDTLQSELTALNDKFLINIGDISHTDAHRDSNTDIDENTNLVKLKLYQSLGARYDNDTREVLVLNKKQNTVSSLKLNDSYSDFFISNYIWDSI